MDGKLCCVHLVYVVVLVVIWLYCVWLVVCTVIDCIQYDSCRLMCSVVLLVLNSVSWIVFSVCDVLGLMLCGMLIVLC